MDVFSKLGSTNENVKKKYLPEFYYNKAEAYSLMDDKENALRCLDKAIEGLPAYKKSAIIDSAFKKYWNDKDFKMLTQE